MVLLLSTTAAVLAVDHFSRPAAVVAQAAADAGLSEPIPPRLDRLRRGSELNIIAWHTARQRLGVDMPTGKGIPVGLVEGGSAFMPKATDAKFQGITLISESPNEGDSGHATNAADHLVGKDAPGQGITEVHCWSAGDWMNDGYLNVGSTDPPEPDHPARVFNHSWVSGGNKYAPLLLRRVDYVVDRYDKPVVCGVNNGPGAVPHLLANAYNVISVGNESGRSSDGLTEIEGEGRCKPELVAPGGATSWSTPIVTGCVAALLEMGDRMAAADPDGPNRNAVRSEVVKALLLAGARRRNAWKTIDNEPLDRALGAGVVDLDRSLVMLEGGRAAPDQDAPTTRRYGWSFAPIDANQARTYRFNITERQVEAGFALVWHRRVLGGKAKLRVKETGEERLIWNSSFYTPNLDLKLVRRVDAQTTEQVAISRSKVDNVELIHLKPLEPGRYTLTVNRGPDNTNMSWDYALAWRIEAHEDPNDPVPDPDEADRPQATE